MIIYLEGSEVSCSNESAGLEKSKGYSLLLISERRGSMRRGRAAGVELDVELPAGLERYRSRSSSFMPNGYPWSFNFFSKSETLLIFFCAYVTISMNKKAKLARLSSAFRLRLRFRSYIVLRFVGTRRPAPANDGVDEVDGRESWVYVGLEYLVEASDDGIAILTDCARRETHLASRSCQGSVTDFKDWDIT